MARMEGFLQFVHKRDCIIGKSTKSAEALHLSDLV
jgi:hypothetical protein